MEICDIESHTELKMKNEPIIQPAKSADAFSLAKLAEKTFRGAFAKYIQVQVFQRQISYNFFPFAPPSFMVRSKNPTLAVGGGPIKTG